MYKNDTAKMIRAGRTLKPTVVQCEQCTCLMEADPKQCENNGYGFLVICPHCGSEKNIKAKVFCITDEERQEEWGE